MKIQQMSPFRAQNELVCTKHNVKILNCSMKSYEVDSLTLCKRIVDVSPVYKSHELLEYFEGWVLGMRQYSSVDCGKGLSKFI